MKTLIYLIQSEEGKETNTEKWGNQDIQTLPSLESKGHENGTISGVDVLPSAWAKTPTHPKP